MRCREGLENGGLAHDVSRVGSDGDGFFGVLLCDRNLLRGDKKK